MSQEKGKRLAQVAGLTRSLLMPSSEDITLAKRPYYPLSDIIPYFIEPPPNNFWEIFPAYSLSLNLTEGEALLDTRKQVYSPDALWCRYIFLSRIECFCEGEGELDKQHRARRMIWDLFSKTAPLMEAHLLTRNYREMRFLTGSANDTARMLWVFFRPKEKLTSQNWVTMQALLANVWLWAREWHLSHYAYIHFACHALLKGFVCWLDHFDSHWHVYEVSPYAGWLSADCELMERSYKLLPRSRQRQQLITPKGFTPYARAYRGSREEHQQEYVEEQVKRALGVMQRTCLASLSERLQGAIERDIRKVAQNHCKSIDQQRSKNTKTIFGQDHSTADRDVKWTVRKLLYQEDWETIARTTSLTPDAVRKQVEKMAKKLYLPKSAVLRERSGRPLKSERQ
jgi:hypothetical protein